MNILFTTALAVFCLLLVVALLGRNLGKFLLALRLSCSTPNASEGTAGTHKTFTRISDDAHTYRHLLVTVGSSVDNVAICGVNAEPVGLTDDSPQALDVCNVIPLGAVANTVLMTCATAIAQEADVYTAANGFVQGEPAGAGTYWRVGRAKYTAQPTSVSNVYTVEVEPCTPERLTVTAGISALAFSSTPTQAQLTAFTAALVTAFTSPGKVKLI